MLEKSGDLTHTLETIIMMMLAETGCTCNILCRQQHVIIRDKNMKVSIDGSNSLAWMIMPKGLYTLVCVCFYDSIFMCQHRLTAWFFLSYCARRVLKSMIGLDPFYPRDWAVDSSDSEKCLTCCLNGVSILILLVIVHYNPHEQESLNNWQGETLERNTGNKAQSDVRQKDDIAA